MIRTVRERQRAAIMGIVNVTPDSFYDGGKAFDPARARAHVDLLIYQGAEIVDIGGESSRPGALEVPAEEQLRRISSVVDHALERGVVVSVDTTDAAVADEVLHRGVQLINDVSCLRSKTLADVVAKHQACIVITHNRGRMAQMPGFSRWPDDDYGDVVEDVLRDLSQAQARALESGVSLDGVLLDPGFGFAKNARHSLELLARFGELCRTGRPLVAGPGRKSFIQAVDSAGPNERLGGTIAASVLAAERGADVVRVHDVAEVRQALAVTRAARAPSSNPVVPPRPVANAQRSTDVA